MKNYKYIIHISDIQVRKMSRHTEYRIVFDRLYEKLSGIINDENRDQFLIVITGDIFHQKIDISNEQQVLVKSLFSKLMEFAEVVVIAGNHDLLVNNPDRLDSITPIVDSLDNKRIHYLKESKCYGIGNITFANYSVFAENSRPAELDEVVNNRKEGEHLIGLFHAIIDGSIGDNGMEFKNNNHVSNFKGLDMVLCGDIHLHQEVKADIPIVYAGSLIQQNFGEKLNNHGFLFWNIEKKVYKLIEVENDYNMVQFELSSIKNLETELKITNEQ